MSWVAVGSMVVTAVAAGIQAYGVAKKEAAEQQANNYQAGVARINKQIAQQNAEYSRATGEVEAEQSGIKTRQQVGGVVAAKSASGLDVGSGSAADVIESQRDVGIYDQALIRSNAARRAFGYEVEATKDESQAQLFKMGAGNAKTAGDIGVASSILGGAGSVASKWMDASRVGIGTGEPGYYGGSPSSNSNLIPT